MRTKTLVVVLLWIVFLGIAAYRLGTYGLLDSLAASVPCPGGQCLVPPPAPAKAARADLRWPPRVGEPYPDLELIDQTGRPVRLSSFKGSVIVVEPVGMTCPACQAFSGAHRYGSVGGVVPQRGLPSIEEMFPRFTNGLSLSDERIVLVQLLLYSLSMGAPSPDDARRWAEHFRMDRAKNRVVLAGTPDLLGQASYDMIPGFQLVDRNFILRVDSTGHQPRHDLYRTLLPMVAQLLEKPSVEEAYRAIPHRRTVFDPEAAKMSQEERAYLQQLFELVDLAVVERVEALGWLTARRARTRGADDYDAILNRLGALAVPPRLVTVRRLVVEAIQEQRAGLEEWRTAGVPANLGGHPLVASSSTKLRQAYAELMGLFPQEGPNNKAAFFDYLCALDFI